MSYIGNRATGNQQSMNWLELTSLTPAENLACDEALLDDAEARGGPATLRFWESSTHFVVVGYAGRVATEANVAACKAAGIPIHRRCTGGGSVLQGPGCLSYSLVLPIEEPGPTASIADTNRFVMERHCRVLTSLLDTSVCVEGHTDLALSGLKFSGNAQRRRQNWLLFHGTFLIGLELALVEKVLPPPARQPDYRKQRRHADFLTQLPLSRDAIKSALKEAWSARTSSPDIPGAAIEKLVAEKYSRPEWNLRW
jgi:lipoate-protein ligase A